MTLYPHDGYFSVSGRGEYGHWDISNGKQRAFRIRGDRNDGFVLMDERGGGMMISDHIIFDTPFEAMVYAARELILTPNQDEK